MMDYQAICCNDWVKMKSHGGDTVPNVRGLECFVCSHPFSFFSVIKVVDFISVTATVSSVI